MATILYTEGVINPELEIALEISPHLCSPGGSPGGFLVRWSVSERLSYLEGHFPGFAVLPAIATLDVTLEALRRALQQPELRMLKLQNAKFLQPIRPGDQVEIRLTRLSPENSWKAEWTVISVESKRLLVAELALGLSSRS